jgi:hypothetical protein
MEKQIDQTDLLAEVKDEPGRPGTGAAAAERA